MSETALYLQSHWRTKPTDYKSRYRLLSLFLLLLPLVQNSSFGSCPHASLSREGIFFMQSYAIRTDRQTEGETCCRVLLVVVVLYGPLFVVAVLQCREKDVAHYSFIWKSTLGQLRILPFSYNSSDTVICVHGDAHGGRKG